jgi:hypothetical protein
MSTQLRIDANQWQTQDYDPLGCGRWYKRFEENAASIFRVEK